MKVKLFRAMLAFGFLGLTVQPLSSGWDESCKLVVRAMVESDKDFVFNFWVSVYNELDCSSQIR